MIKPRNQLIMPYFFICRKSLFSPLFLHFCICGAGRDSVSCQRWTCPDMGLDPGCLPIGHPARLHGVITRAGCTCCLCPVCQRVSVGAYPAWWKCRWPSKQMPRVLLFAKLLTHTIWFTNDWLTSSVPKKASSREKKEWCSICQSAEVLVVPFLNNKHFCILPSNLWVASESAFYLTPLRKTHIREENLTLIMPWVHLFSKTMWF